MLPPNFNIYETMSYKMRTLLENYTDKIEQYSIDEFFIEYNSFLGTYEEVSKKIQTDIFTLLGFTVNIGISDVKILAKMASNFEKPNKIHTLFRSEIKGKLWPLKVEDMFFLGKEGVKKLKKIGIDTIAKLANTDNKILESIMHSQGLLLKNYANGIDLSDIIIKEKGDLKSIGNSKTLQKDLYNLDKINTALLEVITIASKRLRDQNLKTRTITVNLKNSNFKCYSSSHTLPYFVNSTNDIFEISKNILKKFYKNDSIRLVGISFSNLQSGEFSQTNIFEKLDYKNIKIDKVIDSLNSKFNNSNIITRGSLIKKD